MAYTSLVNLSAIDHTSAQLTIAADNFDAFEWPSDPRRPCDHCRQTTEDDVFGGCGACGAPRIE